MLNKFEISWNVYTHTSINSIYTQYICLYTVHINIYERFKHFWCIYFSFCFYTRLFIDLYSVQLCMCVRTVSYCRASCCVVSYRTYVRIASYLLTAINYDTIHIVSYRIVSHHTYIQIMSYCIVLRHVTLCRVAPYRTVWNCVALYHIVLHKTILKRTILDNCSCLSRNSKASKHLNMFTFICR